MKQPTASNPLISFLEQIRKLHLNLQQVEGLNWQVEGLDINKLKVHKSIPLYKLSLKEPHLVLKTTTIIKSHDIRIVIIPY